MIMARTRICLKIIFCFVLSAFPYNIYGQNLSYTVNIEQLNPANNERLQELELVCSVEIACTHAGYLSLSGQDVVAFFHAHSSGSYFSFRVLTLEGPDARHVRELVVAGGGLRLVVPIGPDGRGTRLFHLHERRPAESDAMQDLVLRRLENPSAVLRVRIEPRSG